MVKYGKQYRKYQIEEWKSHYINYKALKQKIKQIKTKLPKEHQPSNVLFGVSNINPMPLIPDNSSSTEDQNLAPLFKSKYGKYLKEFIDLLNEQFHKFYVFFSNTEKQLYQEINTHLYTRENYHKFNRKQIKNELNSLGVSIYLAKCLNCFINDNLTAVKKILKKFDKNFMDYFGLIAPRYILSQISSSSNDLDYIIQFKIIDDTTWDKVTTKPEDGCYVYGMFLEGARWNYDTHLLDNSLNRELYTDVPLMHMLPVPNREPPKSGIYNAPLYKVLSRQGTLSTTGHSTNFVLMVELPTKEDESKWIKAGVAMFLALKQ